MRLAERLVVLDRALTHARLPHAFGGALALAFAVEHPRATADIDVNIFVPTDDTETVLDALPDGVAVTASDRRRLELDGQTRLWWDHTPVDVFLSTHDFHDHAARRVVTHPFAGSVLPFLHPTDLVVFKAMFDRPKDRVDITSVVEARTADLDEAQRWIDDLVGADSANAIHLRDAIAATDLDTAGVPARHDNRSDRRPASQAEITASRSRVCGSINTAHGRPCQNPPGCTIRGHERTRG